MLRFHAVIGGFLSLITFSGQASCLTDFNTHMDGVYHHGPYEIEGHSKSDSSETRIEVKFIYPNRYIYESYDAKDVLTFGAIDIEDQSWRYTTERGWHIFSDDDPFTLKGIIFRGSGNYALATKVACPDPVPNTIDNMTNFQYIAPAFNGHANILVFVSFDNKTDLPIKAAYSWSNYSHFGESTLIYHFDPLIRVDPPIIDTSSPQH